MPPTTGRNIFANCRSEQYWLDRISNNIEKTFKIPILQWLNRDTWVRNISGEPQQTSFWLQTSTDRFYPDFVVKLKDGRILIVEYKGADWLNTADTDEKTIIGQVLAERSGNLFLMATKKDAAGRDLTAQINSIVRD